MTQTENKVIQCRRDTAANWASNNPTPKAGELCFETDTGITKIGDGATAYNSLVPFRQTTATKTELDKLHGLSTTSTELGYVHGVTSEIQTQMNAKFAKADIQTSFGSTPSDSKVASEKLVKNTFDTKQDGITVANNSMLKASVLSAMNIVGENNCGRRYDEPKTYAKMLNAAHSTFDGTKFTSYIQSSNLTITDNGIVSGFANNPASNIKLTTIPTTNKYVVTGEFTTPASIDASIPFSAGVTVSGSLQILFSLRVNTNNSRITLLTRNTDGTNTGIDNTNVIGSANTSYKYKIVVNNANVSFYINDSLVGSINNFCELLPDFFIIGADRGNQNPFTGTIDLKQFSIVENGTTVFSGNKTGIDTVKPDNYTVVGTPTISADGIASGFNSSSIIKTTDTFNFGSTFELYAEINTGTIISSNKSILTTNSVQGINIITGNGKLRIQLGDGTQWITNVLTASGTVSSNTDYLIKLTYDGMEYALYVLENGTWTKQTSYASATQFLPSGYGINLGGARGDAGEFEGSIDLNAFKIYVDGNLVYQPCLKIPYTESKTGSKIVNSIYRDRVTDMSAQFGVAPYHILDEDNGNFAFPYGSVEEKVAPKIVVGHYEDGASAWEQYLDRTMIQRGTMVADTDVTFPCSDAFADTNYTLSCPFSAKTTSGFTPSASGTYIAVGKF